MDNVIHVACCFDRQMTIPAAALIGSIHRTRNPDRGMVVHAVVDSSVEDEFSELSQELKSKFFELNVIRISPDDFSDSTNPALSKASFFRLGLDQYLPELDRVLYLDADTIVRRDLGPLYSIEFERCPLAAMPDYALNTFYFTGTTIPYGPHRVSVHRYVEDVVRTQFSNYFNSGVMALNLGEWRKRDLGPQCLELSAKDPNFLFADQDALNRIVGDDYVRIDPRWNCFSYLDRDYGDALFDGRNDCDGVQNIRDLWASEAWIVHFAYDSKPWLSKRRATRYENEFWDCLQSTETGRRLRRKPDVTPSAVIPALQETAMKQDVPPPPEKPATLRFSFVSHKPEALREQGLPLLSFVVTNHNYARFLQECVESILLQDYPRIECVVVDDASTDDSRDVLARLKDRFPQLRIVLKEKNGGQSASAMVGFELTKGAFVAFVDADDYLLPGFAGTHIQAHLSLPNAVGFTSADMAQMIDGQIVVSTYFEAAGLASNRSPGKIPVEKLKDARSIASSAARIFSRTGPPPMRRVDHRERGWVWSPMSGNVYRRAALALFMDNPILPTLRKSTDAYLNFAINVFSGSVLIDSTLAVYRIHGGNNFTLSAPLNAMISFDRSKNVTAYAVFCAFQYVQTNSERFRRLSHNIFWLAQAMRTLASIASDHPDRWRTFNNAYAAVLAYRWRIQRRSLGKVFERPSPPNPHVSKGQRRIGILSQHMRNLGGGERKTVALASHLARRYEVAIFAGEGCDKAKLHDIFDVDLHDVTLTPTNDGTLRETIDGWTPDVLINISHESELPCRAPAGVFMCMFPARDRPCPPGYDVITANSAYTADWIKRRWGRESENVFSACRDMGPPTQKDKIILNVGRFFCDPTGKLFKRQDILVDVFAQMRDEIADGWELHLAGTAGPDPKDRALVEALRERAKSLPVQIHTSLDFDRLRDVYRRASIYWHAAGYGVPDDEPQMQEHFGMTIVEAMSAGAVPIVFDGGGPRLTVKANSNGMVWTDKDDLVEKTHGLISSPGRLTSMAAQAVSDSDNYSSDKFLARMDEIVDRLLAKKARGL